MMVQFLFKNWRQTFSETKRTVRYSPDGSGNPFIAKPTCSLSYCHTIKDCNVQRVGSCKNTVFVAPKKYTK